VTQFLFLSSELVERDVFGPEDFNSATIHLDCISSRKSLSVVEVLVTIL
jgi:hypothetical protein